MVHLSVKKIIALMIIYGFPLWWVGLSIYYKKIYPFSFFISSAIILTFIIHGWSISPIHGSVCLKILCWFIGLRSLLLLVNISQGQLKFNINKINEFTYILIFTLPFYLYAHFKLKRTVKNKVNALSILWENGKHLLGYFGTPWIRLLYISWLISLPVLAFNMFHLLPIIWRLEIEALERVLEILLLFYTSFFVPFCMICQYRYIIHRIYSTLFLFLHTMAPILFSHIWHEGFGAELLMRFYNINGLGVNFRAILEEHNIIGHLPKNIFYINEWRIILWYLPVYIALALHLAWLLESFRKRNTE